MTTATKQTILWFASAALCSLLVLLVVFSGLSGGVLVSDPEGIPEAADAVLNCICTGNWDALGDSVAGNPTLNPSTGEAHSAGKPIWEAYQNSLQWSIDKPFEIAGNHVIQPVTVTCLDIPGVAQAIATVLEHSGASASDPSERQRTLYAAAEQVLETDAPLTQYEITLTFLREKRQWLVLPDAAFQNLLSGFIIR